MTRWKWISQVSAGAAVCATLVGCAQPQRVAGYSAEIDSDTRAPVVGLRLGPRADGDSSSVVGPADSARHNSDSATGTTAVQPAELPAVPDALGPSPVVRLQKPGSMDGVAGSPEKSALFADTSQAKSAPPADKAAADTGFNPTLPYWAQQSNLSAVPNERAADAEPQRLLEPLPTGFAAAPQFFDPKEIFHHDLHELCPSLCRDACETVTWDNGLLLLAGGGASLAFRATLDDDIAHDTAQHADRWGRGTDILNVIGNPGVHLGATAALYGWSLHTQDDELHSLSCGLFNALVLTDLSTLGLKLVTDTERPDGGHFGWPSGHTSSSVAVAAVLDEYYGHEVGAAAYVLAGLVGWARIDDRKHDLSDVVFGAALGYVIGKSVAREHHTELFGMQLTPFADYRGTPGVGLERRF